MEEAFAKLEFALLLNQFRKNEKAVDVADCQQRNVNRIDSVKESLSFLSLSHVWIENVHSIYCNLVSVQIQHFVACVFAVSCTLSRLRSRFRLQHHLVLCVCALCMWARQSFGFVSGLFCGSHCVWANKKQCSAFGLWFVVECDFFYSTKAKIYDAQVCHTHKLSFVFITYWSLYAL